MKVFMTGGSGFVGMNITRQLIARGDEVTVLTRKVSKDRRPPNGVSFLEGDPTREGPWQEQAAEHNVFINLAGASIFRRWTGKAKQEIRDSRLLTTRNLVAALEGRKGLDTVLLSTSAVGYYGFHGDEFLDETSPSGEDFLALLAGDWEGEALRAEPFGVRVLLCRFGIVLGRTGGALSQMVPLFRKGLGSALGNGSQWFSWIHEQDLVNIFLFLMDQKGLSGSVNFTAPEPVTNREFTKALGKALGKPTFLPAVPGFVLRMIKGEFGSVLLQGQRVIPKKLLDAGFRFQFPTIEHALADLMD
ncbi:MAG: TIGR01777 family oxidoreductase [Desulfatiglandaceae bacterium]|jgi:hypothetical protein